MADSRLEGKKVAVIVSDGFEQVEFDKPVKALKDAGATVHVIAEDEDHLGKIKGVNHLDPAQGTSGDKVIDDIEADDYDALLVPGGAVSPDTMRRSEAHLDLVRAFVNGGKPTFVICHGPWLLADSGVAKGRSLTSWPSIRKDLERAGAAWRDEPVVVDENLVTSRKPDDIPQFIEAIFEQLGAKKPATGKRQTA